jgi:hypothetical protein
MNDIKTATVLYLSKDRATDQDQAAARLFARCQVELRHVSADVRDDARRVTVDVLIHAKPDTIGEIKSSDAAGRLENAMRAVATPEIRHLQWVEEE